jgi:hypothetical protein
MSLGQCDQILMTHFVFDNARQMLRGQDVEGVGPLSWLNPRAIPFERSGGAIGGL